MRAARVQELRDLLLVLHAIELRLNRVRRGGHLTERESRGEDFNEDGFHGGGIACPACSKHSSHGTLHHRPLGSAAEAALSRRSFHSSGVEFDLSVMAYSSTRLLVCFSEVCFTNG